MWSRRVSARERKRGTRKKTQTVCVVALVRSVRRKRLSTGFSNPIARHSVCTCTTTITYDGHVPAVHDEPCREIVNRRANRVRHISRCESAVLRQTLFTVQSNFSCNAITTRQRLDIVLLPFISWVSFGRFFPPCVRIFLRNRFPYDPFAIAVSDRRPALNSKTK